ncbi:inositol monophosphatase family protein [Nesterenkonia lutea]|uniref:inositol-phosphate phosphatase n=1 Tax=Nesterenkonia lutea TaxID=272919 RepID=A0ABR9JAI0_9MICC|nr:inositol monophosphatase family protein [Nesterenkonia lutea]MBE1522937.1 myo-inositol-1(or 4)-monophosphatase [Nesterenkonia lutea]
MPNNHAKNSPLPDQSESRPDPRVLRLIASAAAQRAGLPLAEAFRARNPPAGMDVTTKSSSHDLLTRHDGATETALARELTEAFPDSRVTGEEQGARGTGALEWIVDPIDGTSNFVHGFAMFSLSIAAVFAGEVIAGVVHDPVNGLTFSADDDGAYLFSGDAEIRLESPRAGEPSQRGEQTLNLMTSYPSAEVLAQEGRLALDTFAEMVSIYSTVRRVVSGALELCHAAAGWADVVIGVDTRPWDIAAGMLILRRAGGTYLALGHPDMTPGRLKPDHLAPDYLGLAPGVDSPAARRLIGEASARRRRFSHS